jgi:protein TonB
MPFGCKIANDSERPHLPAKAQYVLEKWRSKPHRESDDVFVWSASGLPVTVHLNLTAARRLDAMSRKALSAIPRRGLEIGGLLLGRVSIPNTDQYIVAVDDFDVVDIEHLRGPSYTLSGADRQELQARMRPYSKPKSGMQVVGFFRSHTRPGLYLDEYDLDVLRAYFAQPSSVALLLRPASDGLSTAGFFVWEEGDIHRASSYRVFEVPAEQADFVADASGPAESPLPAQGPVVSEGAAAAAAAPAAEPDTTARPEAPPAPAPWRTWVPFTAAAAVLAVSLWQFSPARVAPPVGRQENALRLNVEPLGIALKLTWDKDRVRSVQGSGKLAIADGGIRKEIGLDREQLERGSLVYVPANGDVNFRLEVGHLSDSLRAIAPAFGNAAEPQRPDDSQLQRDATRTRRSEPSKPQVLPGEPEPPRYTLSEMPTDRAPTAPAPAPLKRPQASTKVEPVKRSGIKRALGAIPALFRARKTGAASAQPARPARQVTPRWPASLKLEGATTVSVKVAIDETGRVKGTELLTRRIDSRLAESAMDAARRWRFDPAHDGEKKVGSELVLHFRFSDGNAEVAGN